MKVVFHTNVDQYKGAFPDNMQVVPRIGECVEVKNVVIGKYRDERLPTRMVVKDVTYTESYVAVELWYRKIDIDLHTLNNTYDKLFQ